MSLNHLIVLKILLFNFQSIQFGRVNEDVVYRYIHTGNCGHFHTRISLLWKRGHNQRIRIYQLFSQLSVLRRPLLNFNLKNNHHHYYYYYIYFQSVQFNRVNEDVVEVYTVYTPATAVPFTHVSVCYGNEDIVK